ncbi:MAG: cation diffusion facilitator family transporter, partial [Hyphomicrobium sp.]
KEIAVASSGSTKVVVIALACNFGIAVAKFTAAAWTQSSAMLSEAIHSLVDTSNQALLLYGIHRSQRPADARHPFGYSKELYFWSFVVAIMLFSLGAGVSIYEGFQKLSHPHPITNFAVNYVVLAVAMALEGTRPGAPSPNSSPVVVPGAGLRRCAFQRTRHYSQFYWKTSLRWRAC